MPYERDPEVRKKKRKSKGRVSDRLVLRLDVGREQIALYEYWPEDFEDREDEFYNPEYPDIPSYRLFISKSSFKGRKEIELYLNKYSTEELDALVEFFKAADEIVRPAITDMDARAEQEQADGDDTSSRLYRPIPRVVRRTRNLVKQRDGL